MPMDYKIEQRVDEKVSLLDKLCTFEASNLTTSERISPVPPLVGPALITIRADMWVTSTMVKPREAPGPDDIPRRAQRRRK